MQARRPAARGVGRTVRPVFELARADGESMSIPIALRPRDVTRVPIPLVAGIHRLTVTASGPVRVAVVTSAGPIRLRTEPVWAARDVEAAPTCTPAPVWREGALFVSREPLAELHLWPVDEPVTEAAIAVGPAAAWEPLCPDWALGPIRQPPRAAEVRPGPVATPASWWPRVRLDAAEAVQVDGETFSVAESGIVRLTFDPPLAPGRVLMRAQFLDPDRPGAPALVEPQLLAEAARSPRARLATMRRQWGATHVAVLTLTETTGHLLLRPRETEGRVRIRNMEVRTGWRAAASDPAMAPEWDTARRRPASDRPSL